MPDLACRWPDGLELTRPGLRLQHLHDHAAFKLQVFHEGAAAAAMSLGLPSLIGATSSIDTVTCASIAPGEWLAYGPAGAVADVGRGWAADLARTSHLLTDITHASIIFLLSGHDLITALAAHCPLDFSERRFAAGTAARSLCGDARVFIARTNPAEPIFVLIVDQAMARYVVRLISGSEPTSVIRSSAVAER